MEKYQPLVDEDIFEVAGAVDSFIEELLDRPVSDEEMEIIQEIVVNRLMPHSIGDYYLTERN